MLCVEKEVVSCCGITNTHFHWLVERPTKQRKLSRCTVCVAHGLLPTDGHRARGSNCPIATDPHHDSNSCDKCCMPKPKGNTLTDMDGVSLGLHDAVLVKWEKEAWNGWFYGTLEKINKNDFEIYYPDADTYSSHSRSVWTQCLKKTEQRIDDDE